MKATIIAVNRLEEFYHSVARRRAPESAKTQQVIL